MSNRLKIRSGRMPIAEIRTVNHPMMPEDYLKKTEVLQTILCKNFAERNKELRPLKDYRICMRDWGRDYLKAFLKRRGIKLTQSEILDFERRQFGIL